MRKRRNGKAKYLVKANQKTLNVLKSWGVNRSQFIGKLNGCLHVWTGSDTLCRMNSTGGLNLSHYMPYEQIGERKVCALCREKMKETAMELDLHDG